MDASDDTIGRNTFIILYEYLRLGKCTWWQKQIDLIMWHGKEIKSFAEWILKDFELNHVLSSDQSFEYRQWIEIFMKPSICKFLNKSSYGIDI